MNDRKSKAQAEDMFDRIADRYERYVPWKPRLAREIPFLEAKLRSADARRVLDCACGPGRHAVALTLRGFEVVGLDASSEMLERAKNHAQVEGVDIELVEGRFEALPPSLGGRFDALICLGNSLSAAGDPSMIEDVVRQFAFALREGGVAITQTVDFSVAAPHPVTPSPARYACEDEGEFLFVKSFVRIEDRIFIHWVSLEKCEGDWRSEVTLREVTPVEPRLLQGAFSRSGFSSLESYGEYSGSAFEPGHSRDLIVVAKKDRR